MKNNKGFSLVELIIVIAIMAVLIGVLAPQYLRYVEKSKRQADYSAANSVFDAAKVACADPELQDALKNCVGGKITVTGGAKGYTFTSVDTKVKDDIAATVQSAGINLTSTTFGGGSTFIITFKKDSNGYFVEKSGTACGYSDEWAQGAR